MKVTTLLSFVLEVSLMAACSTMPPPKAAQRPHEMEIHGDRRDDPYYWMRDRENPEVIQHLKQENAYTDSVLSSVKDVQSRLYDEMRSRTKEDDSSYPFEYHGFYYYSRFEKGQEYPIYARKKGSLSAPEEVLLNVNHLAKGHEYFAVPFPEVSPDGKKLIYAVDTTGRRFYDLHVFDIEEGRDVGLIPDTAGEAEWAADSHTLFYVKQDPETLRAQYVFRHQLGHKKDELIFEEKDETFSLGLTKSRNEDFIFLHSDATLSNEWRYLDARKPNGHFEVFSKRQPNLEYSLEDGGDAFYVVTNWDAKNFRLMKAPRHKAGPDQWKEMIPNRKDVLLVGVEFFKTHYAVEERENGLTQLRVVSRATNESHRIHFPDPAYVIEPSVNPSYNADFFRYSYTSMNRPVTIFDYQFGPQKSVLRKQKEVPNYDPSLYESERVWADSRDGVKIPISIVYKKGFQHDGSAPLLQYAYGSYGLSMEPWFNSHEVSLLDRGWVYAIVHVRGGSEMGRSWYDDGKLLKKRNTFNDFVDATNYLTINRYGDGHRIYAEGGSAGGLLMGAILNIRPDLYHGVLAAVPFVDVLTTMLDTSIPLTTGEFDEWGDPRKKDYYNYMKSYSPYDNVKKQDYPFVFITAGLHDSQVQYWEPLKWALKLRDYTTSNKPILLHTEMDAGHGGSSGRFEQLKETARDYSFFLWADKQDY